MFLLIGLGNPGQKHIHNRHNVGFMFLDFFAQKVFSDTIDNLNSKKLFEQHAEFRAELARVKNGDISLFVAKPQTYMNHSGQAVRKLLDFYSLSYSELILVHDDLDIAFGEYKISFAKGPKVHNGVTSVEKHLGSKQFFRIRIGIEHRQQSEYHIPGIDYVLTNFSQEEKKQLPQLFEEVSQDLSNRIKKNLLEKTQ